MSEQNRQPEGAPTGGQFAATARPQSDVTLTGDGGLVSAQHASGALVHVYVGDDGAIVVDFDTSNLPAGQRVRVNVNDGAVFDGDPEAGPEDALDPAEQCEQAITAEVLNRVPSAISWEASTEEWDNGWFYSNTVLVKVSTDTGEAAGEPLHIPGLVDELSELSDLDDTNRYTTRECVITREP